MPLIRGRLLDARDAPDAPYAVVVNQTLARNEWPDRDPIGEHLEMGAGDGQQMTVVGVVGDVRQLGLDQSPGAELYVPFHEITTSSMWPRQLVVRTVGDPLALGPAIRAAIWSVDPDQPVSSMRTMSAVLDAELGDRNTQLTLTSAFAVLALLLAVVGLYGVLSYTVSQSTAEIGLRMALGAEGSKVVGAVVRAAIGTALLGITLGLAAAFALARTIESFLYGVRAWDPATAAVVAGVLLTAAALAALVPAWRAASVDPAVTLRAET